MDRWAQDDLHPVLVLARPPYRGEEAGELDGVVDEDSGEHQPISRVPVQRGTLGTHARLHVPVESRLGGTCGTLVVFDAVGEPDAVVLLEVAPRGVLGKLTTEPGAEAVEAAIAGGTRRGDVDEVLERLRHTGFEAHSLDELENSDAVGARMSAGPTAHPLLHGEEEWRGSLAEHPASDAVACDPSCLALLDAALPEGDASGGHQFVGVDHARWLCLPVVSVFDARDLSVNHNKPPASVYLRFFSKSRNRAVCDLVVGATGDLLPGGAVVYHNLPRV